METKNFNSTSKKIQLLAQELCSNYGYEFSYDNEEILAFVTDKNIVSSVVIGFLIECGFQFFIGKDAEDRLTISIYKSESLY